MTNQTPTPDHESNNSTRQYLTISVVLLLLAMGISMFYKSCSARNTANTVIGEVENKGIVSEFENHPEDETLNDIIDSQEDEVEAEAKTKRTPNVIGEDKVEEEIVEESEPIIVDERFKEKGNQTTVTNIEKSTLSKYMVIAGSFSTIENARVSLEHTILSGFENAEIVHFDNSKYHTVCALRSDNEAEARRAITKLKAKKIDAFLHTARLGRER